MSANPLMNVQALAETLLANSCQLKVQRSTLGEIALFVRSESDVGGLRGVLRFYAPSGNYGPDANAAKREEYLDKVQSALVDAGIRAGIPVTCKQ